MQKYLRAQTVWTTFPKCMTVNLGEKYGKIWKLLSQSTALVFVYIMSSTILAFILGEKIFWWLHN